MAAAGVNWVVDQTADEGPKALLEAVQLCVDLGLNVNDVNSMELTAVDGAANRGSDDIIHYLAEQGPYSTSKTRKGGRRSTGRRAYSWRHTRRNPSRRRLCC